MPNRLSTQQNVAVFTIGSARKQRRLSLFEMRMGVQGLCLQATQQIQCCNDAPVDVVIMKSRSPELLQTQVLQSPFGLIEELLADEPWQLLVPLNAIL